jgi:RND family efflux transporter MFP subunit
VERDSRTLEVRAKIPNETDQLRPGMSFSVVMRFPGDTYLAVDPLAVQWDSDGSYLWKLVDGKVQRTAVRIVQRNPETVLVEAALEPGDEVVTEGVLALREGASVTVAGAADDAGGDGPARERAKNDDGVAKTVNSGS